MRACVRVYVHSCVPISVLVCLRVCACVYLCVRPYVSTAVTVTLLSTDPTRGRVSATVEHNATCNPFICPVSTTPEFSGSDPCCD